jgi:hypothetical protein
MKELNEFLAVEVMGWLPSRESTIIHAAYFDPKKYDEKFASDEQGYEFLIKDWNPSENIEQAMMCLDQYQIWRIDKGWNNYYLSIYRGSDHIFAKNENRTLAISLACARAKGWKDE